MTSTALKLVQDGYSNMSPNETGEPHMQHDESNGSRKHSLHGANLYWNASIEQRTATIKAKPANALTPEASLITFMPNWHLSADRKQMSLPVEQAMPVKLPAMPKQVRRQPSSLFPIAPELRSVDAGESNQYLKIKLEASHQEHSSARKTDAKISHDGDVQDVMAEPPVEISPVVRTATLGSSLLAARNSSLSSMRSAISSAQRSRWVKPVFVPVIALGISAAVVVHYRAIVDNKPAANQMHLASKDMTGQKRQEPSTPTAATPVATVPDTTPPQASQLQVPIKSPMPLPPVTQTPTIQSPEISEVTRKLLAVSAAAQADIATKPALITAKSKSVATVHSEKTRPRPLPAPMIQLPTPAVANALPKADIAPTGGYGVKVKVTEDEEKEIPESGKFTLMTAAKLTSEQLPAQSTIKLLNNK